MERQVSKRFKMLVSNTTAYVPHNHNGPSSLSAAHCSSFILFIRFVTGNLSSCLRRDVCISKTDNAECVAYLQFVSITRSSLLCSPICLVPIRLPYINYRLYTHDEDDLIVSFIYWMDVFWCASQI